MKKIILESYITYSRLFLIVLSSFVFLSLPQSAYCMGKKSGGHFNSYNLQSIDDSAESENGSSYCPSCGIFDALQSKMSNSDITFTVQTKEHGVNWWSCGSVSDVCTVNSYTIDVKAIFLNANATKATTNKVLYQDLYYAGFTGIDAKKYLCDGVTSWLSRLSTSQVVVIPECADDGIVATVIVAQ
jgi:hypothetical protein